MSLYGRLSIPSDGSSVLIEKNITENGTYNATDDNADGFSKVVVAVQNGDLDKIQISQAEYDELSDTEKMNQRKIYFITNTIYVYYQDVRYSGEFPIEIESTNTVLETSSQGITLEEGYHYLMTTIYSGGIFTNATIEAGSQRVFNLDGYDRTIYVISTSATNVSYSRNGTIDSNKFIKFRIKQNGQYVDDLMFTNEPQSAWNVSQSPTISVDKDSYYLITYKASLPPNITGATPICYAYIGETDSKKSISMIIKADASSITISDYNTSYLYFYYQKLIYS